ncbi:MAG: 4Fe-4S dicluster domain-containing protein [Desulfobacterota bacterium]|nr:4Fe-4S dicluster domain-containing protein [Thermodesulfobacteriota bacterium]MDW8001199.1 4Fe-4S dicluster domain-containing protein [Deltaproteobacteria bacterium]
MIVNGRIPRVYVFEPSSDEKRKHVASIHAGKKSERKDLSEIKSQLREVRLRNRELLDKNVERFKEVLTENSFFKLHFAQDAKTFLGLLRKSTDKTKVVSLNKSNVLINEVRPFLRRYGYRSFVRYFSEFNDFTPEKKFFTDYWMLPGLHEKNLIETFGLKSIIDLSIPKNGKDYVTVLGVNAASAKTGNLYFLQHMSNITKDLEEAKTIFVLVPLEKIVEYDGDAKLHVQSMGIFGLESVILDLKPKREEVFEFERIPFSDGKKEVHIVIFDNGRKRLLSTAYSDLLLCIDCRACARQCPVGQHIKSVKELVYSPKNLLFLYLIGRRKPFEFCLHCGRCEVECPVGIPIPELLWKSQIDYSQKKGRSIFKVMFDNPELFAKVGTLLSPVSNWLLEIPIVRTLISIIPGIHAKAKLPKFSRTTFREWYEERKKRG